MKKLVLPAMIFAFTCFNANAQVKMMTYNIKYANEQDGENSWSQRKDFLAAQLQFHEPDIFGVQEALYSQLQFLEEKLKGYEFFGKGRDDGAQKGEFSAIFFNPEKFKLLDHGNFWLSATPEVAGKGWDAAYPRVCTYGKFRIKDSEKEFWVFNTHFDHVGAEARNQSVRLIHKSIKRINKENLPVVLMGDLNLEPDTEEIRFLKSHFRDSKEISDLVFGPSGTFNAYEFHQPVTRRIDYIFTSEGIKVNKYGVLSDSRDLKYPSDHFPVVVQLEF